MKNNKERGVKIKVMRREFTVACTDEDRQGLIEAAVYLDKLMNDINNSGKVLGMERCAIMAALNISHDLLQLRKEIGENGDLTSRLSKLYNRIDRAVTEFQQISL